MYERVVTFEGPDFHSEVTPVRGSTLAGKIHQIADTIIQHVAGATNDRVKITRLALNFKVDYKDRLHFLFASSLRLRGSQPLEVNTMLQVPEYIHRAQSVTRASPAVLMRSLVCPTCHQKVHPEMLFDVAYRVIIEYEEQCLAAQRKAKGGDAHLAEEVPPTLRAMHPRLQLSEYLALRKELAFHHKIARVCEGCYLRFSTVQLGAKERLLAPELAEGCGGDASVLFGTGDLDPQRLALRRDATRQKILQRQAMEDAWWDALPAPSAPKRASSCPKLPSWGPDHKGAVLWPPAPVLSRRTALPPESLRPSPPAGPRPRGCELQQVFSTQSPRRRKSQVRGEPYLKAIQDFTAQYRHRAQEVLGPTAELALQGAVDPKRPATEVAESEPEDAAHRSDEETEEKVARKVTAASTPSTTRPPSRNSAPSSKPTSRPSTRTSSRGALHGSRSRPSSSPAVGMGARSGRPARPASSPTLRSDGPGTKESCQMRSYAQVLRAFSAGLLQAECFSPHRDEA
ncbi:unnamed protein product [Effrenium voratum]|nr:unnamed protein product [Effrenium voratum]